MRTLSNTLHYFKPGNFAPDISVTQNGKERNFREFRKGKWTILFTDPVSEAVPATKIWADFIGYLKFLSLKDIRLVIIRPEPPVQKGATSGPPSGFLNRLPHLFREESSGSYAHKVIIIDPQGVVRSVMVFPNELFPFFDEVLITIEELQHLSAGTPWINKAIPEQFDILKLDQRGFKGTHFSLDDKNLN